MSDDDVLLAISRTILAAIKSKDAAPLERILAPGFFHRNERGDRTSREPFLEAITGAPYEIQHADFETIFVDVLEDLAVVAGIQTATVRLPDGQSVTGRTAFTDVFVRAAAGWQLCAATSVDL